MCDVLIDYCKQESDHIEFCLPLVDVEYNGIKLTSLTMYAEGDAIGDLALNWEETGDEVTDGDMIDSFYGDDVYTADVIALLKGIGVADEVAEDVGTSENGMQDVGRASYDANSLGLAILALFGIEYNDE